MPIVPALATLRTAQRSATLGAAPSPSENGPSSLCSGAVCSTSCANSSAGVSVRSAPGPACTCSASTPTASITRSGPMPPVSSRTASIGSSSSKLTISAPCSRAMSRRSTWRSMLMTRPAPCRNALMTAKTPTGPAHELRLHAVVGAGCLGAAEERRAGRGLGRVALRVVAGAAVHAEAARDRLRDHHAIADPEIADVRPDLLDDPNALVTQDRSRPHARHRAAHEVQVGPADRAGGEGRGPARRSLVSSVTRRAAPPAAAC